MGTLPSLPHQHRNFTQRDATNTIGGGCISAYTSFFLFKPSQLHPLTYARDLLASGVNWKRTGEVDLPCRMLHSASSALLAPDTEFAETASTTVSTAWRPPHECPIDGRRPLYSDLLVFPIVTLHRQLSRTASSSAARASHRIRRNHFKHRIDRLPFIAWIVCRWLKPSLLTSRCIFDRHPPPSAQQKQPPQHCSRLTLNSHTGPQPLYRPLRIHRTSSLSMAEGLSTRISSYFQSSTSTVSSAEQPLQHCSRLTLNSHQALHPSFQPLSVHRTSALTVVDELSMEFCTYLRSSPVVLSLAAVAASHFHTESIFTPKVKNTCRFRWILFTAVMPVVFYRFFSITKRVTVL